MHLLAKAMDKVEGKDFGALRDVLKGATSIMLSESSSAPAKMINDFRKKNDKPILKGAYVEEAIFIGDDQLIRSRSLEKQGRTYWRDHWSVTESC